MTKKGAASAELPLWRYAAITAVVLVTIAVGDLLLQAISMLALIFVSFLLAVGLEPAVSWLVRHSVARIWAVTIVCGALAVILVGLAAVVLIPAVTEFGKLVSTAPDKITSLSTQLGGKDSPIGGFLDQQGLRDSLQKGLEKLPATLSSSVGAVFGVLTRVVGGVFAVVTVAALTVYFMAALPRIVDNVAVLLGNREADRVWREALSKVGGYLMGQLVISTIAGVGAFAFLLVAGVPFAAVLAVAVALLSFIPQVGAILSALVCVAVALTVDVPTALFTAGFFVVYQLAENYLIAPRVFSKATALSPLVAFSAALVGAASAGFIGAIVALPIAAAGRVVVASLLDKRMSRGRHDTDRDRDAEPDQALAEPTAANGQGG